MRHVWTTRFVIVTAFLLIAAAAIFALAQSFRTAAQQSAPAAYALSGTVRGANGQPVAGALVAIIPHFELEYAGDPPDVPLSTTDAAGRYHFVMIPPGRNGVTATFPGQAAAYGGVHEIGAGARLSVDFTLGGAPILVSGTVRDSAGAPVPGARLQAVRVSPNEGEVFVALAGEDGHYSISLPGGLDYFLVVDAPPHPRTHRQISPRRRPRTSSSIPRRPRARPTTDSAPSWAGARSP